MVVKSESEPGCKPHNLHGLHLLQAEKAGRLAGLGRVSKWEGNVQQQHEVVVARREPHEAEAVVVDGSYLIVLIEAIKGLVLRDCCRDRSPRRVPREKVEVDLCGRWLMF